MTTPNTQFDFLSGTLDSRITFSRANATATRVNATGLVEMVVAVDVTAECKARFPEYLGKHPVILACAGWNDSDCTIVVGENTTYAAIGHELRHCFMGFYHD